MLASFAQSSGPVESAPPPLSSWTLADDSWNLWWSHSGELIDLGAAGALAQARELAD